MAMQIEVREVRQTHARSLCQFATPDQIAEVMALWVVRTKDDRILDPCFGKTVLMRKAMERLTALGATPRDAAKQTYGVEISKRVVKSARKSLGAVQEGFVPHLIQANFLEVDPGEFPVTGVTCNPPYRRHLRLSPKVKRRIRRKIENTLGVRVPPTSDLYVYFLLRSTEFLKDGGRLAFLIPTQYMESNYGQPIREFLASHLRIKGIVIFDENVQVFRKSLSTASLLLAEKGKPCPADLTEIVRVESLDLVPRLLRRIGAGQGGLSVQRIPQTRLTSDRWTTLSESIGNIDGSFVPLGDLVDVSRGIATGANGFFVLSETKRQSLGIGVKNLRPVIAKASFAQGLTFDDNDWQALLNQDRNVWLVDCGELKLKDVSSNLRTYIRAGAKAGLSTRTLLAGRSPWYSQENRTLPPAFFTYMSNGNPRFVLNESGCISLNNLHCLYPRREIRRTEWKALLGYLNSRFVARRLRYYGRVYGNGLLKLEPKELELVPVPDLADSKVARCLALLFEELASAKTQHESLVARRKIDRYIKDRLL